MNVEKLTVPFTNLRELIEKKCAEMQDKTYVAFYDQEITFKELDEKVNRLANGLLKLGVRKGDIVHIYFNNCANYLVTVFAILKLGAVAGPLNTWLKAPEIKYQMNDSKAKYLFIEETFLSVLDEMRPDLKYLKEVIEMGDKPKEGHHSYDKLIAENSAELKPIDIKKDDLAFIFYTGGTTGLPKGVLLTHYNVLYEIEGLKGVLHRGDEPASEVALIFLPLFHVNAMMSMIVGLYRGIKHALLRKFSVREFGPTVEKHKCTFFSGVPKVYKILMEAKDTVQQYNLSSLKYGLCGAAPISAETIKEFEKLFNIEILEGYGLTEGTVASTLHRKGEKRKIGSIGPALPGQEVKIFDENDNELPPYAVGEIVIKGDNVMKGYLGKEEETAKTLRGGYLHTGDIGYVDEEGYFYISDRKKDMIIKGGENIYPKEIEDVISAHPAVHDVAVIGVPDELSGEEVKAFIVPKLGKEIKEEDIINYCKDKLADFKLPKYVELVLGIPASAVGKALKRFLREGKGITTLQEVEKAPQLNLDGIFQMMQARFNKEKAGKWEATIQYEIFGKNAGSWYLEIKEGELKVTKGKHPHPSCIVKLYDVIFMKILTKELDGAAAINQGLMQVEGNESDIAMLGEVFA